MSKVEHLAEPCAVCLDACPVPHGTDACCAHLRVSYRTTEKSPGHVAAAWWECDSGCGTRFTAVPGSWVHGRMVPASPPRQDTKGEREHVLGCDEYHQHRAPQCCRETCWCRPSPADTGAREPDPVRAWIEGLTDEQLRNVALHSADNWAYATAFRDALLALLPKGDI